MSDLTGEKRTCECCGATADVIEFGPMKMRVCREPKACMARRDEALSSRTASGDAGASSATSEQVGQ